MRVNIYAEEMTERIEIISKDIEGEGTFTGLRFYLELPVTKEVDYGTGVITAPGDDDSAAVTFWGKQDLRKVLWLAINKLDEYYGEPVEKD